MALSLQRDAFVLVPSGDPYGRVSQQKLDMGRMIDLLMEFQAPWQSVPLTIECPFF